MYVVRTHERDALAAALAAAEIASASYYVTPLHLQPALRFLGYEQGSLPGDRARRRARTWRCRCGPASTRRRRSGWCP